jgi:hypothetical protein
MGCKEGEEEKEENLTRKLKAFSCSLHKKRKIKMKMETIAVVVGGFDSTSSGQSLLYDSN